MVKLKGKRIVVTGGGGFLGRYIVSELKKHRLSEIIIPRSKDFDLRQMDNCRKVVDGVDIVIHAAAQIGGIGFIDQIPGDIFYNNAIMGLQMMEASRLAGVSKFVTIGTVCEYPELTPLPFKEENLWDGYPEKTTATYGWAKKILLVQGDAYRKQFGFNSVHLLPVNLYGPKDNFSKQLAHVIPALIRRFVEARKKGKESVEIWGSGRASREFLYVEDAASGIVLATQYYEGTKAVNLGSGVETPITELVKLIKELTGFKGNLLWNSDRPDGQPRRQLDVSVAKSFGFEAKVDLREGLKRTIEWYEKSREKDDV